jgi:hypothetical protein
MEGDRKSAFVQKADSYLVREVNNGLKDDMKQIKIDIASM